MDDRRLNDVFNALEAGLKVSTPESAFANSLFDRIVAETEAVRGARSMNRAVVATLTAAAVLILALVGYQFVIAPNIANPAPTDGVPSQSAEPEPSSSPAMPPALPNPCTILSAYDLQSVVQRSQTLTGEQVIAPPPPERAFCAYSVGGLWQTNFWIFRDVDPRGVMSTYASEPYGVGDEVQELTVGDRVVLIGSQSFAIADDRLVYMLKLPTPWLPSHPTALRDLARIVVLNLAASDTPSPTTDESPAAFLDPSIPDWMTIARLPNACRFRIENAIEAVFDVRTRPVSLTSPSSPAGSVCQFWRSDAGSDPNPEAWLGNLHAYPPADGELPSMFNQMGQEGSLMNVDFRDVMVSNCGSPAGCQGCECDLDILIGHEAATLWVILRLDNLDETSGDVERFVGAVLSEMDAWAAQQ